MDLVTVFSARFRKVGRVQYERERLTLSDGDFVDLDWKKCSKKTEKCILLLHGLEGSSQSRYNLGLAKIFSEKGLDVCVMNQRGCSGEPNNLYSCYHSGKTDDVLEVLNFLNEKYSQIMLHGVSLGGNMALKLAGENPEIIPAKLKCVMAVSAPVDLAGSSQAIMKSRNFVYEKNFNCQLLKKLKEKAAAHPGNLDAAAISKIKTLKQFDDVYTSKAHGFSDADDYYAQNSALQFIENIRIPTLLLNAQNDSFLSDKCYPYDAAEKNPFFYLETPKFGGHVAFWQKEGIYYNEIRALEFAEKFL